MASISLLWSTLLLEKLSIWTHTVNHLLSFRSWLKYLQVISFVRVLETVLQEHACGRLEHVYLAHLELVSLRNLQLRSNPEKLFSIKEISIKKHVTKVFVSVFSLLYNFYYLRHFI